MIIRLLLLPMTVCVLLQSACHKPAQRMSTPMAVQDDDRFNGDETIVRDWSFLGIKGQQIRTRHWDIRTTMQSERFKEILPAFYEMAMDQYQNAFDAELPPPRRSMETYIFSDRRQWKNKTRMLLPDKAASFEGLGRGGFTTNGIAVLYDIDGYGWHRDTRTRLSRGLAPICPDHLQGPAAGMARRGHRHHHGGFSATRHPVQAQFQSRAMVEIVRLHSKRSTFPAGSPSLGPSRELPRRQEADSA